MAFLSNLDKKITMLGQGALQKTKEVTDSAMMSSMIKTLDMQKKDNLEKLGKYYYDLYVQSGGELAAPVEEIATRIREIDIQRNQLQKEVQKIKGTMSCPNCNTEIPANSQFCNVCGTRIERPIMETRRQGVYVLSAGLRSRTINYFAQTVVQKWSGQKNWRCSWRQYLQRV